MQTHTERSTGTDRRLFEPLSATGSTEEAHSLPGFMAADSDTPYDPYDPYWEPVTGQDDD